MCQMLQWNLCSFQWALLCLMSFYFLYFLLTPDANMAGNYEFRKNKENKQKVVDFLNIKYLLNRMSDWNKIYSSDRCKPRPTTYPIIEELYNIGWHWGLYENILHASWWYSPSRYGEVNIIMTSAVYSHTIQNKAIQYYYYYVIWSWL